MKKIALILLLSAFFFLYCGKKMYATNGEAIYKTGKNLQGDKLLDKSASRITVVSSCQACHGKHGDAMRSISVAFSYLASPVHFPIPYTDSLFFRFLDHDLTSSGTKASIGVIWKMSDADKKDLLVYMKTL